MKSKALEKKENEPAPQPVVKIVKDTELQQSTIQAMEDLKSERDAERAKADGYKKQLSELEHHARIIESRLNSQEKMQKTLNSTVGELEKDISIYKEKLKASKEKIAAYEEMINNDKRKLLGLENELYEQTARRERAEREAQRLDDHNRELEEGMNKEQSMRHSAERRANRNDQFQEIWRRDRNGSGVNGTNVKIITKAVPMSTEQELAAYRKLTDDLNSQLSSETNIRRHIESRLRNIEGFSGSRMGYIGEVTRF